MSLKILIIIIITLSVLNALFMLKINNMNLQETKKLLIEIKNVK